MEPNHLGQLFEIGDIHAEHELFAMDVVYRQDVVFMEEDRLVFTKTVQPCFGKMVVDDASEVVVYPFVYPNPEVLAPTPRWYILLG